MTLYLSTGVTSRGRVGLTSSALGAGVLTNPWFQDPVDKGVMIAGINEILGQVKNVPGLAVITPDNTTTVTNYVNNYPTSSMNSNHWVGSCSIGKVVDENARVYNTTNLVSSSLPKYQIIKQFLTGKFQFIADASIIPALVTGNPQGPIMSMAEQAAAKILALAGGP